MNCIASLSTLYLGYQERFWRKCLYFSELLKKGYISKVALSFEEKQLLTCLFSGEIVCDLVVWRNTVNVSHTGEMLNFRCARTITLTLIQVVS